MEQELQEQQPDQPQAAEHGDNTVSVVTDLPAASFIVSGPAEYRGSGTFWVRKGAPPGTYTVTFNPVAGYATPPVQTKELVAKGQIVFVGKYRRSTELVVDSNEPGAQFTIYRPDGRPLDLSRPGRALSTISRPGTTRRSSRTCRGTSRRRRSRARSLPAASSRFTASTWMRPPAAAAASRRRRCRCGRRGGQVRRRSGIRERERASGAGSGRRKASGQNRAPGRRSAGLDRRVQMVVTSYPPSRIEDDHGAIPYPEVIIRKSNFQQGWCQVYLVLAISDQRRGAESRRRAAAGGGARPGTSP